MFFTLELYCCCTSALGKGKGIPYSITSVWAEADPGL